MVRALRPSRKGAGHRKTRGAGSGAEETRTPDVLLAKEVLYQLSYGPKTLRVSGGWRHSRTTSASQRTDMDPAGEAGSRLQRGCPDEPGWAFLDSNQRPLPYQGSALTS